MVLMIEVRLMITRRSAPATSAPRPKASLTTARNAKRNRATAKEPMVKTNRTFLRKRFAKISLAYFMRHLRPRRSAEAYRLLPARLFQGAEWCARGRRRPDRA